jgi:ElaB/YqjD/DUF883 family membrane-anchored ribosome-binding protein
MDERPDVDERSSEEIERDIVAARESLRETVGEIEERLHRAVDWRTYVGRAPWVSLAVAAGVGALLGHALARRRAGRRRMPYPPAPEF